MKKPLMKKPVGPSELGHGFGTDWNNQGIGSLRAVTCEICGTEHPEIEESETSRTISRFLGYQVVEECCGAIIDYVYRELGEVFAIAIIEEFANDPSASKFYILLETIKGAMKEAAKKLAEASEQVGEISKTIASISR